MSSFQKLFEESTCLWNYIFHHPGNDVFLLCWLFPVWCLLSSSGHHGVSGCSLVSMGCWHSGSRDETKVHVLHAWIGSLTVKLHEEILVIQKLAFCLWVSMCYSESIPFHLGNWYLPFSPVLTHTFDLLKSMARWGCDSARGFQQAWVFGKKPHPESSTWFLWQDSEQGS